MFILCAIFVAEPCADEIVIFAVPDPLIFPTLIVPLTGVPVFTFGAKVKPILLPKLIAPVNTLVVVLVVIISYPVVLK